MSQSGYAHIEVDEIKRETDGAFLFVIDGEEKWVPKSQVADPDDYERGDENCSVSITEWFANKEGIEGE